MIFKSKNTREKVTNYFSYIILCILVFLVNLPMIAMVGASLKTRADAIGTATLFPSISAIDVSSYRRVLFDTPFSRNLLNSFLVAGIVTASCIIIASFAGYAISRFKGKVFSSYAILLLSLQMIPGVLLLMPLFLIFRTLGLIDTTYSVMLAYTAIALPFSTWMLKGFFDTIPFSLEESALIDGCTQFQTFYKIILPLSAPGVASVGIFTFILSWNEYLLASVFLRSESQRTITIGLERFIQQFSLDWSGLMTAASIATIPTVFILFFAQKYLIKGLTSGALKG